MDNAAPIPASQIKPWTGIIGVIVLVFLLFLLPDAVAGFGLSAAEEAFFCLLLSFAAMGIYEVFVLRCYRDSETGLDFSGLTLRGVLRSADRDFLIRILGLAVTIALIALIYWLLPFYRGMDYQKVFHLALANWEFIAAFFLGYFLLIHAALWGKRDEYWHVGRAVLARRIEDWAPLKTHMLKMAIKVFFLPLMMSFFINEWIYLRHYDFSGVGDFADFYPLALRFLYFIDVAIGAIGYMATMRLFNAHIRWTDTSAGGWFFCLMCYFPFWPVFGNNFFNYSDSVSWGTWLAQGSVLYCMWGSVILISITAYAFATVQFGLRFSNLTHRGVITTGLYRVTKHPAYIAKNISYWMIDIPFMAASWPVAIQKCAALIGVGAIYFMRARYEERLLMKGTDGVYARYAAGMKGRWRRIRRG